MTEEKKKFFDERKKKKALEWINEKCPNLICECCQQKSWILTEDMVMPMPFVGGGLIVGGPTYPQVMIVCTVCGNTKYFNAVVMGVVEKEGKANG